MKKFINVLMLLGLISVSPAITGMNDMAMDEAELSSMMEEFGLEGVSTEEFAPMLEELGKDFEYETIANHASLIVEKASQIARTAKQLSKSDEVNRDRMHLMKLKQLMIQMSVVAREMDGTLSFREEPRGFRAAQTDAAMVEIQESQDRAEATGLGMRTLAAVRSAMEGARGVGRTMWEHKGKIAAGIGGLGVLGAGAYAASRTERGQRAKDSVKKWYNKGDAQRRVKDILHRRVAGPYEMEELDEILADYPTLEKKYRGKAEVLRGASQPKWERGEELLEDIAAKKETEDRDREVSDILDTKPGREDAPEFPARKPLHSIGDMGQGEEAPF